MDYEAQRLENLKHKEQLLAKLNLKSTIVKDGLSAARRPPAKKRKLEFEAQPSRTSARLALGSRPSYKEDSAERYNAVERRVAKKQSKQSRSTNDDNLENDTRSLVPSGNAEDLRAGWSRWTATASPPTRDEHGKFHFAAYPDFTPNKSPEEMIREGSFGGSYWRPLKSRKLGIVIEDDYKELPEEWYAGLDITKYLTSSVYDPEINKYKVACGQSIEEWEAAGWISFEHDIRGWFQWYCRFFQGRRCEDDDRQVSRWKKCVGETGRWRRMLLKKYMQMGVREVFDDGGDEDTKEVSPVMHMTCHHWAFEVRQEDLDDFWRGGK